MSGIRADLKIGEGWTLKTTGVRLPQIQTASAMAAGRPADLGDDHLINHLTHL